MPIRNSNCWVIAMLRRLEGAPIRGENYYLVEITTGVWEKIRRNRNTSSSSEGLIRVWRSVTMALVEPNSRLSAAASRIDPW
jgi:predicted nucleic acid-binding protein